MKIIYAIYVLIIVACSLTPCHGMMPSTDLPLDKVGHFIAYCGLGIISMLTFKDKKLKIAAFIFGVSLGMLMECIQHLIPTRTFSLLDESTNIAGLWCGSLIFKKSILAQKIPFHMKFKNGLTKKS